MCLCLLWPRKAEEQLLPSDGASVPSGATTPGTMFVDVSTPRAAERADNPAKTAYMEAQRNRWRNQADAETENRDMVIAVTTGALLEEGNLSAPLHIDLYQPSAVYANSV